MMRLSLLLRSAVKVERYAFSTFNTHKSKSSLFTKNSCFAFSQSSDDFIPGNIANINGLNENSSDNNFTKVIKNNRKWAAQRIAQNPQFFQSMKHQQKPEYLWIGCADSRIPANQILGLDCGQVFVHRNVANLAPLSDINVQACIQYAVDSLKVTDILVAGHYGCGGIKAAFTQHDYGPLQSWLCHIRDLRSNYKAWLIGSQQMQQKTLVQLNVRKQVLNVARTTVVQKAWANKQTLRIHGVIYDLATGILKNTGLTIYSIEHLPEEFRISDQSINKKKE